MINNSSLHPKTFKVFDKNGTELGIYVTGTGQNIRIFIESLNKFVDIQNNAIQPHYNLYFQSTDCTGTPLMPIGDTTQAGFIPDVVSNQFNKFYTFDRTATITITVAHSVLQGSPLHCDTGTFNHQFFPVTPVILPFSIPLELPLQVKYQ